MERGTRNAFYGSLASLAASVTGYYLSRGLGFEDKGTPLEYVDSAFIATGFATAVLSTFYGVKGGLETISEERESRRNRPRPPAGRAGHP